MIKDLKQSDIGRFVIYTPNGDLGRITSFSDKWVNVVYRCNHDWEDYRNYTANSTKREHLIFLLEK